jgi:hypothetical protein
MTDAADLDPGDVVVDRDADAAERDEAVVVNTPPVRADEWEVGAETVAEYPGNGTYPDDDPVAVVMYREAFDGLALDPADVDGPLSLAELDAPHYAFPASRLRAVADRATPEDDTPEDDTPEDDSARDEGATPAAVPEDLATIADTLRERNVDDVTVDTDAGAVRVEKLGVTHTVTRDGTVTDSGAFADALEDLAQAALDDGRAEA